jgi:hypothetical protein
MKRDMELSMNNETITEIVFTVDPRKICTSHVIFTRDALRLYFPHNSKCDLCSMARSERYILWTVLQELEVRPVTTFAFFREGSSTEIMDAARRQQKLWFLL